MILNNKNKNKKICKKYFDTLNENSFIPINLFTINNNNNKIIENIHKRKLNFDKIKKNFIIMNNKTIKNSLSEIKFSKINNFKIKKKNFFSLNNLNKKNKIKIKNNNNNNSIYKKIEIKNKNLNKIDIFFIIEKKCLLIQKIFRGFLTRKKFKKNSENKQIFLIENDKQNFSNNISDISITSSDLNFTEEIDESINENQIEDFELEI